MTDTDTPLVQFEVVIEIRFLKHHGAMSPSELLEAARELRVLRATRSMDTAGPVYRRMLRMERQIARRYAHLVGAPEGWRPGKPLDSALLFESRQHYLEYYERAQTRVDAAHEKVLPNRAPAADDAQHHEDAHPFWGDTARPPRTVAPAGTGV